jgi:O-glycosyl hydrolase
MNSRLWVFTLLLVFSTSCTPLVYTPVLEPTGMTTSINMSPDTAIININPYEQLQTMDGFGASGAWWAQEVGGWETDKLAEIMRLLFDPNTGIGLSIYRYNLSGGDGKNIQDAWRRGETFEISQGEYDWNKDANGIKVLRAAQAEGVDNFVAFVNSPPARMTISGLTSGYINGKSNLDPTMYAQFAQYLVDVVRHLRVDLGIPVGWISPVNEPQWSWTNSNGQEGCHYSPAEVAEVTKTLIQALQKSQMDVKVSVFESGEWKNTEEYVNMLLGDPEINSNLGPLAIHSYWSTPADKAGLRQLLDNRYPGTEIWMTEWTEMKDGRDTGMDSALVLANTLHDDITIGRVTSWQYWIAVSKYIYRDGLIYVNTLGHKITQTKRLWALGNYSRFVRPGFVRVNSVSSNENLRVTAYRSPDSKEWVIVVINNAAKDMIAQLTFETRVVGQHIIVYETSENSDLQLVNHTGEGNLYHFTPHSVTTLIFN